MFILNFVNFTSTCSIIRKIKIHAEIFKLHIDSFKIVKFRMPLKWQMDSNSRKFHALQYMYMYVRTLKTLHTFYNSLILYKKCECFHLYINKQNTESELFHLLLLLTLIPFLRRRHSLQHVASSAPSLLADA